MNMNAEDYLRDIRINKYALDEAFISQPELYIKWSKEYAAVVRDRDDVEQRRKVIRAELDTEYRMEYERLGNKTTESIIDAAIRQDERHKFVTQKLIKAEEQVNIMEAVKWAFEHRKKSLEWLAQLQISGYYAMPRQPEAIKAQEKETIAESLRTRARERGGKL